MIIKVCGMRDSRNIQEVSALAVNWIGLIFYERSPRFIGQSCLLYTSDAADE